VSELDRRKLGAARLWVATRFPYLSTALFAAHVVASPGLGGDGMAVDDRWRLYVDPELMARWEVAELGALLVHHTGHLVRDHAGRADTLGVTQSTAQRWALAADAELNDDLADIGLEMPGRAILPETLGFERGRLAEEYFHRGAGTGDPSGEVCDHGSGAHSQPRPWEDKSNADAQDGRENDGPGEGENEGRGGLSGHEGNLLRAQVASQIVDAMRNGEGNVPSNWQRWAQQLLAPVVDWRRALAAEVRRGVQSVAGCVDYSYRRPSRRAPISANVILPALEKPVPEIAVVCDTSGSMGDEELGRVLAEVEGLLTSIGLRARGIRVLAVDAAVQAVRRVSSARQVELIGGGGTDMARGLEAAAALRPRPGVVVVLTDGMTPWPAVAPPGVRVIIGLLESSWTRHAPPVATPHWARVVRIGDAA
jgi:predicted metal-dependent peptidase